MKRILLAALLLAALAAPSFAQSGIVRADAGGNVDIQMKELSKVGYTDWYDISRYGITAHRLSYRPINTAASLTITLECSNTGSDTASSVIGTGSTVTGGSITTTNTPCSKVRAHISAFSGGPATYYLTYHGSFDSIALAAVNVADCGDIALGCTTDPKATAFDATAATAIALLKANGANSATIAAAISALKMNVAAGNGDIVPLGSGLDPACTTTNSSAKTITCVLAQISLSIQALAGAITPYTSGCSVVTAGTTLSTNCKASAGNLLGWWFINTTATVYYVRPYNLASGPTCSSATGVFGPSIPVPASTTGAGLIVLYPNGGIPFGTGLGLCATGGSATTDNTSSAAGVFGQLLFN